MSVTLRTDSQRVRRRRLVVAVVFAMVALLSSVSGAAVVTASRGSASRPQPRAGAAAAVTLQVSCRSPALAGSLPALVSLPTGYSGSSSRRYPVVYFLHGLPAARNAYLSYPFVASTLAGIGRRAIVVQPQGARSDNADREYLRWDSSEDWPQAISHDLVSCIDARFHTVRNRFGRALIGLSAGGYGAFNIGTRTVSTFGAVESWSGYFVATNPAGTKILDLGSAAANQQAMAPSGPALKRAVQTWPTLLAFYVGAQDSRFADMNRLYDRLLANSGVPHTFRIYPGGHSLALWQALAPRWLGMALDALSAEAARGGAGERSR